MQLYRICFIEKKCVPIFFSKKTKVREKPSHHTDLPIPLDGVNE